MAPRRLPDPEEVPMLPLWPDVGELLGIGRTAAYRLAREQALPTLRVGHRLMVPTAELRKMVGLSPNDRQARMKPGASKSDRELLEEIASIVQQHLNDDDT